MVVWLLHVDYQRVLSNNEAVYPTPFCSPQSHIIRLHIEYHINHSGVSRKKDKGGAARAYVRGKFDHAPNQGREITCSCVVVMNQERILRLKFVSVSL